MHDRLIALVADIDWELVAELGGNRIQDSWAPLLLVAQHIGDGDWLGWAAAQMEESTATLDAGQEEEPPQLVFSAIMYLALVNGGDIHMQPDERVALADIARELTGPFHRYNSWQIGDIVRTLGFEVQKAGGKQYVYIGGLERLVAIGAELGIQDEWLVKAAEHLQA